MRTKSIISCKNEVPLSQKKEMKDSYWITTQLGGNEMPKKHSHPASHYELKM